VPAQQHTQPLSQGKRAGRTQVQLCWEGGDTRSPPTYRPATNKPAPYQPGCLCRRDFTDRSLT
jgi:hypothetical protein